MRFDDIFNDIDNDTAEKLSQEYPVLTDKEKERLYAMSKRKYNTEEMPEMNLNEVSGVEKYSRPKWYKGLSIAAAAVLVFAGIGGSMAVISRNGHGPGTDTESDKAVVTTEAETTEAVTEELTEASTVAENIEQIETDLNEMKRREALLNTRANQKNAADNTFFIFYILLQRISK